MNKIVSGLILIFSCIMITLGDARGDNVKGDSLRLFLIGNSFSQNATRYLPKLAEEGGHPVKIGRAELGGCSLQRHWEIAAAAEKNPQDPKGKAYNGKSLRELLSAGTWDVVTIQQNSMNSGDSTTYMPYAKKLVDLIKSIQPDARIVMQQTWAYRVDAKKFTQTSDNKFANTAKEMWGKSREAYHKIAKELDISLFPVGDAFWEINSNAKAAFVPDSRFDAAKATYPDLPDQTNSLHVGYKYNNSQKLDFDANHANEAGCYLGGLVWYVVLFDESPSNLRFHPEQVSDQFAEILKATASRVVKNNQSVYRK
jgi:lysophospholipase L1-like esterase